MLEIKDITNKGSFPQIEVTIDTPKYSGVFKAVTSFSAHEGYTSVCGTYRVADLIGTISSGIITDKENNTKFELSDYKQYKTKEIFNIYLRTAKLIPKIRDSLLQGIYKYLSAYNNKYHWMFGGRVNIPLQQYTRQLGVYCGSLAGYIVQNKLGTLTASHVHQNSVHSAATDYSMQQFFVWSPLNALVLKSNEVFCGISENEEQVNRSIAEFKRMGFPDNTSKLKPRYVKGMKEEQFDLFEELEEKKKVV